MSKLRDFKAIDLVSWRKRQLLKKALADAGGVEITLDLPCGDGKFWSAFRDMGVLFKHSVNFFIRSNIAKTAINLSYI